MHANCAGGIGPKGFMNSFNWDKNFETGIGVVDEQHQYLVGFINHYGNLLSENASTMEWVCMVVIQKAACGR